MKIRLLLLGASYFLAGKLALQHFAFVHASASPVWPPAGIALAAFLLLGPGVWPAIFVAAFLVNVTTSGAVLTSLHRLENFAEPLERLLLTAERYDVPLEEGNDLLTEHARGRDLVDQDFRVA